MRSGEPVLSSKVMPLANCRTVSFRVRAKANFGPTVTQALSPACRHLSCQPEQRTPNAPLFLTVYCIDGKYEWSIKSADLCDIRASIGKFAARSDLADSVTYNRTRNGNLALSRRFRCQGSGWSSASHATWRILAAEGNLLPHFCKSRCQPLYF